VVSAEKRVVTPGGFNVNDYIQAAQELSQSLIASGQLDKVDAPPSVVVITGVQFKSEDGKGNAQQVTDRIREILITSRKAVIDMSYGVTGPDGKIMYENPTGNAYDAILRWKHDSKNLSKRVDYFLFGTATTIGVHSGALQETTLSFSMTLCDNQSRQVWGKVVDITKQGTRASIGITQ